MLSTGQNKKQHLCTKVMDMSNKGNISCLKEQSVVNRKSVLCCTLLSKGKLFLLLLMLIVHAVDGSMQTH